MSRKLSKILFDVLASIEGIEEYTKAKELKDYQASRMLRSAVEREYEIIGEAVRRLENEFPDVFSSLTNGRKIINFRNILIHAYDSVSDEVVWDTTIGDLPLLKTEIVKEIKNTNE
ncbi:MAG: HepT-like ribonuclease domain-containing protein [Pyrinomonadaceae bacterium]|nr:DUF86 domain-containing protein [Pyrinomonadaceae bacterium]